jgi:hypothetical protein
MLNIAIIAAALLSIGAVDSPVQPPNPSVPATSETVYPKGFTTVKVDWNGDYPVTHLTEDRGTRYATTDRYVLINAAVNAKTADEMGFRLDEITVPTPYAAYNINPQTGKMNPQ